MECNNIKSYLSIADFKCVGLIAKHCDLEKLCISIEQAKNFDIIPLFCYEFVADILQNWNISETDSNYLKYKKVICDSEYLDKKNNLQGYLGFKTIWIYYAYARYKLLNEFNDTANGDVNKNNEFSMPKDFKEIKAFSDMYRNMGREAFEQLHGFLCSYKIDYPKFNDCNCKLECGCSGKCSCGKTKKLYGSKFRIVSKK